MACFEWTNGKLIISGILLNDVRLHILPCTVHVRIAQSYIIIFVLNAGILFNRTYWIIDGIEALSDR